MNERAHIAHAAMHEAELATGVSEFAFRATGTHAVYRSGRMQRTIRDMPTGRQSAAMCDEVWERVGQVGLGLATTDIMT